MLPLMKTNAIRNADTDENVLVYIYTNPTILEVTSSEPELTTPNLI